MKICNNIFFEDYKSYCFVERNEIFKFTNFIFNNFLFEFNSSLFEFTN